RRWGTSRCRSCCSSFVVVLNSLADGGGLEGPELLGALDQLLRAERHVDLDAEAHPDREPEVELDAHLVGGDLDVRLRLAADTRTDVDAAAALDAHDLDAAVGLGLGTGEALDAGVGGHAVQPHVDTRVGLRLRAGHALHTEIG